MESNEWINISDRIPESQYEVEIMDENGNVGIGLACYYPFKVGENKKGSKWGSEIIHLDVEEHDGSWIVDYSHTFFNPMIGEIIKWREITPNQ